jgi:ferritin
MAQFDPVLLDALNKQITNERYSSAIYQALANRLDYLNLPGFAHWFRCEAKQETKHAAKFTDYIIDRNAFPVVAPIQGYAPPEADILTAGTVCFTAALQREVVTTEDIKTLYDLSEQADDSQTCEFLLWFLREQTDSVRETTEMVARATFAQGCPAAILKMDHDLGKRKK